MRIRVDGEICQGHTLCAMSAPDLFALSEEDGHAWAVREEVPPGQEERAREAVRSCPEQAILVLSDEPAEVVR